MLRYYMAVDQNLNLDYAFSVVFGTRMIKSIKWLNVEFSLANKTRLIVFFFFF